MLALGGLAGAVFNAAKEAALDAFLLRAIGFLDMAVLVEHVLERLGPRGGRAGRRATISAAVTALDAEARRMGGALGRGLQRDVNVMETIASIPLIGGFVSTVLPFVVVLGIVVFVHEFGHYIVARWCGIRSEVFSIGFGPVLWSRRDRRGTLWQVAALPLGGYVRFVGDSDGSSRADQRGARPAERRRARARASTAPRSGGGC